MGMAESYNPWRDLRGRTHLELRWAWFPSGTRGRIEDAAPPPRRVITLHAGLGRIDRRATLAHELVHDERGLLPRSCPDLLRAKDEHAVRVETARRLVPPGELRAFVAQRCTVEAVTVADVAERFEVPDHVARLACELVR
jgi:hypothetical protein